MDTKTKLKQDLKVLGQSFGVLCPPGVKFALVFIDTADNSTGGTYVTNAGDDATRLRMSELLAAQSEKA